MERGPRRGFEIPREFGEKIGDRIGHAKVRLILSLKTLFHYIDEPYFTN